MYLQAFDLVRYHNLQNNPGLTPSLLRRLLSRLLVISTKTPVVAIHSAFDPCPVVPVPQFCPHFADHVWRTLLQQPGSVLVAGWPAASTPDVTLQRANAYLQEVIVDLRKLLFKQLAPPKKAPKKGAEAAAPPAKLTVGNVFIAEKFGGWQVRFFASMLLLGSAVVVAKESFLLSA